MSLRRVRYLTGRDKTPFEDMVRAPRCAHNDDLVCIGHKSPHVTIEAFPDNVLLDIFELCLQSFKKHPEDQQKVWRKLVHVC